MEVPQTSANDSDGDSDIVSLRFDLGVVSLRNQTWQVSSRRAEAEVLRLLAPSDPC